MRNERSPALLFILIAISLIAAAGSIALVSPACAHEASPVVALLTDYGTSDHYAGVLKGVILRGCPEARIVDITHEVPSYDIRGAARTLFLAAREFPPATVFLAVVDPGVGTARRPIAIETANGMRFVAPDNGLLTLVADSLGLKSARVISNPAYMTTTHQISSTFHGRDIFAPVTAYLACGTPIDLLGPPAGDIVKLDFPAATVSGGIIRGQVERVDTYGNVLTNISRHDLETLGAAPGDTLRVRIGQTEWGYPWRRTYGDVASGARVAVIASAGELELALNQDDLGRATGAAAGGVVEVTKGPATKDPVK